MHLLNERKIDFVVSDLCDQIDELKEAAQYWKQMYEQERDERNREANERLAAAQKGIGQALLFALAVKDNEDGSLSINKEDRQLLAESYNTDK